MTKVIPCPDCKSEHVWMKGTVPTRKGLKSRMQCADCGCTYYSGKKTSWSKVNKDKGVVDIKMPDVRIEGAGKGGDSIIPVS